MALQIWSMNKLKTAYVKSEKVVWVSLSMKWFILSHKKYLSIMLLINLSYGSSD